MQLHCEFFFKDGAKIDRTSTETVLKKTNSVEVILTDIFSEEFKPADLWSFEFEDRQNAKIKWTFSRLWPNEVPASWTEYEIDEQKVHPKVQHRQFG